MMGDRKMFVDLVKAVGQEVIDRAEDLVGEDVEFLADFDIWLRFDINGCEFPQIEVTRSYIAKNAIDVLAEKSK